MLSIAKIYFVRPKLTLIFFFNKDGFSKYPGKDLFLHKPSLLFILPYYIIYSSVYAQHKDWQAKLHICHHKRHEKKVSVFML